MCDVEGELCIWHHELHFLRRKCILVDIHVQARKRGGGQGDLQEEQPWFKVSLPLGAEKDNEMLIFVIDVDTQDQALGIIEARVTADVAIMFRCICKHEDEHIHLNSQRLKGRIEERIIPQFLCLLSMTLLRFHCVDFLL